MAARRPTTTAQSALSGWSRCVRSAAAGRGQQQRQQQRRTFATDLEYVKPSGFMDVRKYLTDFEGSARKKGPMPQGKRGPRPQAFMEYGASTVIRGTVARKAPGGNIRKYKVTSIIGNSKGWAGIGVAQSVDSGRVARTKSLSDAMRNMFYIERYRGKTVYHQVTTKLGATRVELWPRRTGSGVKAGKIPSMLMQRLGITDVGVKIRGSRNKTMQLKSTIKALSMIESHEHAAKRRGVMLPRLNYHDYRRVCEERSEAAAHSLLFAEEEPGASMPGMKASRPRPSLPMMGIEAVRKDPSLRKKMNERKVALHEHKRAQLLTRLQAVRDRSDTPIYDRIIEVCATDLSFVPTCSATHVLLCPSSEPCLRTRTCVQEMADLQRELAAEAEANEAARLAELELLEKEREEMRLTLATLDPELLAEAAPAPRDAEKMARRAEAQDAVFDMCVLMHSLTRLLACLPACLGHLGAD
jgi:ribosomal protein S5